MGLCCLRFLVPANTDLSCSQSPVAPKGIQLTNHPSDLNNWESDYKIVEFPADPTTAMHKYGINWQSGEGAKVTYSFDGQKLEGPTKFSEYERVCGTPDDG